MNAERIKIEPWEDGEKIITIDGKPCGFTLTPSDAIRIKLWLISALGEISEVLKKDRP